jgi:PTH1 family peptidyl-tRNA hydrolase
MKLFVGLGNPGSGYAHHRHNVGFMALDRIAERHGLPAWRKRFHGLVTDGPIGGRRVMLIKPQTYMNDSGQAVGEAQRYLKIDEDDIYVFHDEIDLAPSKLKVKKGGGNAGHNGLRSITAHIGNEYARVRIGVGHPGSKDLVSGYVLHDFAKADREWLEQLLDAMAEAAGRLAAGDEARFLTDVARRVHPEREREHGREREHVRERERGATGQSSDAEPPVRDQPPAPAPVAPPKAVSPQASPAHPAGERQSKRGSALAENLKRWLRGRSQAS